MSTFGSRWTYFHLSLRCTTFMLSMFTATVSLVDVIDIGEVYPSKWPPQYEHSHRYMSYWTIDSVSIDGTDHDILPGFFRALQVHYGRFNDSTLHQYEHVEILTLVRPPEDAWGTNGSECFPPNDPNTQIKMSVDRFLNSTSGSFQSNSSLGRPYGLRSDDAAPSKFLTGTGVLCDSEKAIRFNHRFRKALKIIRAGFIPSLYKKDLTTMVLRSSTDESVRITVKYQQKENDVLECRRRYWGGPLSDYDDDNDPNKTEAILESCRQREYIYNGFFANFQGSFDGGLTVPSVSAGASPSSNETSGWVNGIFIADATADNARQRYSHKVSDVPSANISWSALGVHGWNPLMQYSIPIVGDDYFHPANTTQSSEIDRFGAIQMIGQGTQFTESLLAGEMPLFVHSVVFEGQYEDVTSIAADQPALLISLSSRFFREGHRWGKSKGIFGAESIASDDESRMYFGGLIAIKSSAIAKPPKPVSGYVPGNLYCTLHSFEASVYTNALLGERQKIRMGYFYDNRQRFSDRMCPSECEQLLKNDLFVELALQKMKRIAMALLEVTKVVHDDDATDEGSFAYLRMKIRLFESFWGKIHRLLPIRRLHGSMSIRF